MNDDLLESLEAKFLLEGWTWKVGGKHRIPDKEDINAVLKNMKSVLSNEPPEGQPQFELGRLIMKRRPDGQYDVFIYQGEYRDDS